MVNRHTNPGSISKLAIFQIKNVGYRNDDKINDLLTVEFLRHGYDLVERTKIEKLIEEQKFNLSGFVDEKKAVAIGKLAGADTIVIGNGDMVGDRSSDKLKHLVVKLIDVETGSVIIAVQITRELEIQDAVPWMIQAMQDKLTQKNPK